MNTTIFKERLQECRRRKYSSQQAFADAYMNRFGLIRDIKKTRDHNMFGTVQSWEQGKSTPSADVLANICDLLDCDADYLLGRIDQRTHDINDAHRYTGLSAEALEQLHQYHEDLQKYPDPEVIYEMAERWPSHPYYQAYALYLIDELLVGSKSHKLSVGLLSHLFEEIEDGNVAVKADDYLHDPDDEYQNTEEERELMAAQSREELDIACYHVTNNIRDILYENAVDLKLPKALEIRHISENTIYFSNAKE